MRLSDIALDGPLGRFNGDGAFAGGVFALQGATTARCKRCARSPASRSASGGVHGPLRATVAQNQIVVQTTGWR